jgi:hypothetical protein
VNKTKPKPRQDADVDRTTEIERLAALDPFNYEAVRADAAKQLRFRASALDRAVYKTRRALGLETKQDGQGRAVKIIDPLPWHEPVDGDRLASTLAAAAKTYLVLSDIVADTIALWVMHTWAVNVFTMSPRLAIVSPTKGCGKTTLLRFLSHVARRAKRAGSISPPALFRAVEQFQPTVLLDETEKYVEHGGDLHALLNEGHCKGGSVWRVLGEKQELREFSVFGPLAFARNGRLPDDLEQRSIVIEMQRRRADESLSELRDDRSESLQKIAKMCARWADGNAAIVADYDPNMEMINRNRDNWRPLFAIADVIGDDWPDRVRAAAATLAPRESETFGVMLLADIKMLFEDKSTDRLASAEICVSLAAMENRPWAEWKASKVALPKPITKNQLAQLLKPFHIVSDSVRIDDHTPKGYYLHQFAGAFERYLAAEEVSETQHRNKPTAAGTNAALRNATDTPDVALQKCEKPSRPNACCGVAFQKGVNGLDGQAEDRSCRQCGDTLDGTEQQFLVGGNRVWLHPECRRFFAVAAEEGNRQ